MQRPFDLQGAVETLLPGEGLALTLQCRILQGRPGGVTLGVQARSPRSADIGDRVGTALNVAGGDHRFSTAQVIASHSSLSAVHTVAPMALTLRAKAPRTVAALRVLPAKGDAEVLTLPLPYSKRPLAQVVELLAPSLSALEIGIDIEACVLSAHEVALEKNSRPRARYCRCGQAHPVSRLGNQQ